MSAQAAKALDHLSSLMELRDRKPNSERLHRRAEEMRYLPELGSDNAEKNNREGNSDDSEQQKWEKYGLQLREVNEEVVPLAIQSMLSIADMHASRNKLDEAIRVMERVLEIEEQRCGALDARLVPLLIRYSAYVEDAGRTHEATALRLRAAELRELRLLPPSLTTRY